MECGMYRPEEIDEVKPPAGRSALSNVVGILGVLEDPADCLGGQRPSLVIHSAHVEWHRGQQLARPVPQNLDSDAKQQKGKQPHDHAHRSLSQDLS